jgi:DNA-binding NarL/FixJ family response regulator
MDSSRNSGSPKRGKKVVHRRPAAGEARVRVVIADDNPMILDQIGGLLEPRFEIVGRAKNGRELFEAVRKLSPSVVVTDITMPEVDGIEATRRIINDCPGMKVLVLSVHDDPAIVEAAFEAGASGYVSKLAGNELIPAIEDVLAGRLYRSVRLR